MGKYLFRGSYSAEGLRGVIKDGGTSREKVVETLAESVGGSLDSFHFAFGDDSYFVVCDLPNDEAAAAVRDDRRRERRRLELDRRSCSRRRRSTQP